MKANKKTNREHVALLPLLNEKLHPAATKVCEAVHGFTHEGEVVGAQEAAVSALDASGHRVLSAGQVAQVCGPNPQRQTIHGLLWLVNLHSRYNSKTNELQRNHIVNTHFIRSPRGM
jgi:hypothetical protein